MSDLHVELLSRLEAVLGPLQTLTERPESGPQWFAGSFRGIPVRVGSSPSSYTVAVSLYGRPIRLEVRDHTTTIIGMSVVATGDPSFDRHYRVFAYPAEVALGVLDGATRAWIAWLAAERDPEISTEDGELRIRRPSIRIAADGDSVPTVAELSAHLEATVSFAMRLTETFDAIQANIARTQGKAASDAWAWAQVETQEQVRRRRRRFRIVVLGVVVAIFVVPVIATLALVMAGVAATLFR
ncbi:MAG: hypothetical protein IT379_24305 [Deltaproteobacteria bacterium]|nr:hypothetical protein [Deltaproteobacteria bacterium]